MRITNKEVCHIATLSRLSLSETEIEKYRQDLNAILDYVETLQGLDTEGIEPTIQALSCGNVMRDDVVTPSLAMAAVVCNAPAHALDHFRVPPVIE
ncbi:Asp-tRNA(Asn)/Glu-tRNA(Gln) amidotransferase subunit GatC [Chrysiogenes arsenatis]|uniref:Asp-tRNA(Asn)/Glu-tRNA(Gln) amidotransferase subunit GatC n=1 Tax=Chrysiogenes arsenatis TaxID=309797 RepID=UPI0003FB3B96|nr:Asp-tRNA(Asn)/Glu-tRNA(Gln) amidotransferase subunit GatC [Chrysiogenes arsenatis]